jgi:uracil-DNA glycosylase
MSRRSELENFDWMNHKSSAPPYTATAEPMIVAGMNMDARDMTNKFINQLYVTCMVCSICDIGVEPVGKDGIYRDPHFLSNRNITRYMLVCDRPDLDTLISRDNNSDSRLLRLLKSHALHDRLYVTYLLKCGSDRSSDVYYNNCRPYLDLEVRIIQPSLIITAGPGPFNALKQSDQEYVQSLKKIINSKYGSKMFVMSDINDILFADQLTILNNLLKRIDQRKQENV